MWCERERWRALDRAFFVAGLGRSAVAAGVALCIGCDGHTPGTEHADGPASDAAVSFTDAAGMFTDVAGSSTDAALNSHETLDANAPPTAELAPAYERVNCDLVSAIGFCGGGTCHYAGSAEF